MSGTTTEHTDIQQNCNYSNNVRGLVDLEYFKDIKSAATCLIFIGGHSEHKLARCQGDALDSPK